MNNFHSSQKRRSKNNMKQTNKKSCLDYIGSTMENIDFITLPSKLSFLFNNYCYFETGYHIHQACLKISMSQRRIIRSCSSCSHLLVLGLQVCTNIPSVCGAEYQGSLYSRQSALYQLSYVPSSWE